MSVRRLVWALAVAVLATVPPARAQCSFPVEGEGEAPALNYISEGTRFTVLLDTALESRKLKPGKRFAARLGENLMAPDGALIVRNSRIKGHIGSVDPGAHGRILLAFDSIQKDRHWLPFSATVIDVFDEHGSRLGQEEAVKKAEPSSRKAASGGTSDAFVTATGTITANHELKLNKGQELELQLDRPLPVPKD